MSGVPKGKKVKNCRICGGKLKLILDLGFHPPSDKFLTEEQLNEPEVSYPLRLFYCPDCTLAQLDYIVPKEILFGDDYPYETGVNEGGIKHFRDFADEVMQKYPLKNGFAVDIGGNDGTFLQRFEEKGFKVLNIDPCGVKSKVEVWKYFWSAKVAEYVVKVHGQADIITATNVLAHTEDLRDFMEGVNILLKDDGVFVIETPFFDTMIEKLQFDQIYHEHLSYFNLSSIRKLLIDYGFDIWAWDFNEMHGGSIRVYAKKGEYINYISGMNYLPNLREFAEKVKKLRERLRSAIYIRSPIAGIAASAKGNTLLNYCGFTPNDISYITDKSLLKQGKFTPGSHIKIYSDEILINEQPKYALMLACNFKKNIVKAVRDKGYQGKFIIPYPEVSIE